MVEPKRDGQDAGAKLRRNTGRRVGEKGPRARVYTNQGKWRAGVALLWEPGKRVDREGVGKTVSGFDGKKRLWRTGLTKGGGKKKNRTFQE